MQLENGQVVLTLLEVLQMGPHCLHKIATDSPTTSWFTHAVAWCYLDWDARQRMADDGWPPNE